MNRYESMSLGPWSFNPVQIKETSRNTQQNSPSSPESNAFHATKIGEEKQNVRKPQKHPKHSEKSNPTCLGPPKTNPHILRLGFLHGPVTGLAKPWSSPTSRAKALNSFHSKPLPSWLLRIGGSGSGVGGWR